ncbi:MAG: hypothetical protein ABJJ53_01200 [Sulfitobacter sp.]
MSKAVTHEEVEDVLSSIRRLVSEDKRPLAGLRSATSEVDLAEVTPEASDRFVLTPALRVLEDEQANDAPVDDGPFVLEEAARETADEAPMMLFPGNDQTAPTPESVDALVQNTLQAEAQTTAENDLDEGDYSDEEYWDVEDDPNTDASEIAAQADVDTDGFDWNMGSYRKIETPLEIVRAGSPETPTPEAVTTEVEPAIAEDVAQDAGAFFAGNDVVEAIEEKDAPRAEIEDTDTEEAFFEPHEESEPAAVDAPTQSVPLTEKIAALEAAVSDITNDWEPDGDEIDTLAASAAPAMAWEDDVTLDAKGAPVSEDLDISDAYEEEISVEAGAAAAAATTAFAGDEDQLIDEAALREMVSEIVRAELQGALGERITRNVRKLVRREIHRALTAQDME